MGEGWRDAAVGQAVRGSEEQGAQGTPGVLVVGRLAVWNVASEVGFHGGTMEVGNEGVWVGMEVWEGRGAQGVVVG